MVSPNSSTDNASSGSMEEKEQRFYRRSALPRQAPNSTSSSAFESESDSENKSPQKKPQPPPTNVAISPKPSTSTKRPRDEEQTRGLEKNKKPKEVKKAPPLENPKQNEKKMSEVKKKVKKSESPPKSAKKNGQLWSAQDVIEFVKAVVAFHESKGLPKNNMTPLYDYIKNLNVLEHEYSNLQMYDKLRRLKTKFVALKDKINAGDYSFKNPHEEVIYKIGRKLWRSGEEEEEESSDEENGAEEVDKKAKGKNVELAQKENGEEEEEDEEEQGNLASNGVKKQSKQPNRKENRNPSVVSGTVPNHGSGSAKGVGKLIDLLKKENLDMMNGIKDQLAREKEESKNEIMKMVREALKGSVSTRTGDSVQFSSEKMIKRISSSREWPALEKAEVEKLEHKWHRQNLVELDASSKHLLLLQEECQLRMEKLRSQVEEQKP